MTSVLWPAVLAVVGTLAGCVVTGALAARSARVAREAARGDAQRKDVLHAVASLVAALADHRRAMWVREDTRLSGADWAAAREASHVTRSAVTAPLTMVCILAPSLASLARQAAQATDALRGAATGEALAQLRCEALRASDRLFDAAQTELAQTERAVR
jgi:hypothetical protein